MKQSTEQFTKLYLFFSLALAVSACGVKQAPVSPIRPNIKPNIDCSIYEAGCPVSDLKYDPACDPARKERPPICDLWNKKYDTDTAAHGLSAEDIGP